MYLSEVILSADAAASATEKTVLSFGERISTGLSTALLGLSTIFLMLTILFIMLKLMSAVFAKSGKKKEKAAPVTLPVQESVTVAAQEESADDEETVAAIVAAISAYTGSSPASFRVVSFKRIYSN
ncbi:MAG: OadG family protein [Eubacteriales bacterium]